MSVICIYHSGTDPYFTLAAEEYLLKNFEEDIFMLWKSKPSIIVGKHQNALAEINHRFVRENKIKIARRLSGGGTVFHDPGNLNFTFIQNVERIDQVNFKTFTQPIVVELQKLGLNASTSGRNDLLIEGKKVSGNAEHIYKKRVLHHGTLLFNSKLDHLKQALKVDLSRFQDKAVQSNRSEVTNIADHLQQEMTIDEFAEFLFDGVSSSYIDKTFYQFSEEDLLAIQKLRNEKYYQWDWIYGYSPKYSYSNSIQLSAGKIEFTLSVKKGRIVASNWTGDLSVDLKNLLVSQLQGACHDFDELLEKLKPIKPQLIIQDVDIESLLVKLV